jgi:hypothetical protein
MQKRIVINKGKTYLVNAPSTEDVGSLAPMGTLWMQSITDNNWYSINLTGTSASNDLAIYVNQTPLEWESPGQDFGYQLLYCYDNNTVYQTYLSGSAGNVTMSISQTPWSSNFDYKPYLLLQSLTDSYFYTVSARSGSIYLFPNPTSRTWLYNTSPPANIVLAGSLIFGDTNQDLFISGSNDFVLGTGSWTVEWFQKMTNQTSFGRVFTQNVWPSSEFGVSIENAAPNAVFYLWLDAQGNTPATANSATVTASYLNQWDHFAVSKQSGSFIQIFRNGVALHTMTGSNHPYISSSCNISSSLPLVIGSEGDGTVVTRFSGSISNFRLVKGYALYSGSYAKPSAPLTAVPGTVLLLNARTSATAFTDSSGTSKIVISRSVAWSDADPFNI